MSKPITPMKKLSHYFNSIKERTSNIFSFQQLSKKDKAHYYENYTIKKTNGILHDCIFLFSSDTSINGKKSQDSIGFSFDYINKDEPEIFFSTLDRDKKEPIYSRSFNFEETKELIKKFDFKLRQTDNLTIDLIKNIFKSHFIEEKTLDVDIKKERESGIKNIKIIASQAKEIKSKIKKSEKEIEKINQQIKIEIDESTETKEIEEIEKKIRELNNKKFDLQRKQAKKISKLENESSLKEHRQNINDFKSKSENLRRSGENICKNLALPTSFFDQKMKEKIQPIFKNKK